MTFLKPEYLLFMLLPALFLFYLIATNRSAAALLFDKQMARRLTVGGGTLGRTGRNALFFAAIACMIVALARPAIFQKEIEVQSSTLDVMIAIDISKSMLAGDFYPNRLEFAKKRALELITQMPQATIGAIAFSKDAFLVSPLTADHESLAFLIASLDSSSITSEGTDLAAMLAAAERFLSQSSRKAVVVLSDGGDAPQMAEAIAVAKKADMRLYLYDTATEQGSAITTKEGVIKNREGNIVISKRNPAFKSLALETEGAYIEASYDDAGIRLLTEEILRSFDASTRKNKRIVEYQELFYYPLAFALLLLFGAMHSRPMRAKSSVLAMMLGIGWAGLVAPLHAGMTDFWQIDRGERAYHEGNYTEAIQHLESVASSKQSPESYYDLGNAHYKAGAYDEAIAHYRKVKTTDTALQFQTHYNMGNALAQSNMIDEAIGEYEKALALRDDADARHNLELLKQKHSSSSNGSASSGGSSASGDQNASSSQGASASAASDQSGSAGSHASGSSASASASDAAPAASSMASSSTAAQGASSLASASSGASDSMPISDMEQRKWEELLERMTPKTLPMKLEKSGSSEPAQGASDVSNPW